MVNRICILAPDLIPVWSGIASYTIGLLKNLPKDIELHVLTTQRELPGVDSKNEMKMLLKELGKNVKIYPICKSTKTLVDHAKFQASCASAVPMLNRKLNFDFLHTNFPLMSELLISVTKRLRIPFVSTIHTTIEGQHKGVKIGQTEVSKLEQTDFANLFLNFPLRLAEQICLVNYSKIIATSNFILKELKKCFPFVAEKDTRVVHNGVDTDFFCSKKDYRNVDIAKLKATNRPIILFTGRFVATKGIHNLVQAIPNVVKEYPDVLFVFAGGGDCLNYFTRIKQKTLKENCYFLGYLPRNDMPEVYSVASIFAMPTLYESFPLRLLESMACETPAVATRICGIPEVIKSGENGFLIPPKDSNSLASRISYLLENKHLLKKAGTRARQTVLDHFSARIMTKKTLTVYTELFCRKPD